MEGTDLVLGGQLEIKTTSPLVSLRNKQHVYEHPVSTELINCLGEDIFYNLVSTGMLDIIDTDKRIIEFDIDFPARMKLCTNTLVKLKECNLSYKGIQPMQNDVNYLLMFEIGELEKKVYVGISHMYVGFMLSRGWISLGS